MKDKENRRPQAEETIDSPASASAHTTSHPPTLRTFWERWRCDSAGAPTRTWLCSVCRVNAKEKHRDSSIVK